MNCGTVGSMSPIDAFLYACIYGYVFLGFGYFAKEFKNRIEKLQHSNNF